MKAYRHHGDGTTRWATAWRLDDTSGDCHLDEPRELVNLLLTSGCRYTVEEMGGRAATWRRAPAART